MKGISPLIASILLIAFTVAVGGLVSLWISGYAKTQTTQVSQSSNDQIACTSVMSVSTYNPIFANTSIGVRVSYDYGTLNLSNPIVSLTCGANTTSTSLGTWIVPGQLIAGNVSNTACSALSSITIVRAVANCTGPSTGIIYTRTADCTKNQVCIQ